MICGWLHKCQPKASVSECLKEMSGNKVFTKWIHKCYFHWSV